MSAFAKNMVERRPIPRNENSPAQPPRGIEDIPSKDIPTVCNHPGLFLAALRKKCRPCVTERAAVKQRNKKPDVRPIDTYKAPNEDDTYVVEVMDSKDGRRFFFHKVTDDEQDLSKKEENGESHPEKAVDNN